jgi:hypothetical protein
MKFELDDSQIERLEEWQKTIKERYGEFGGYKYSFTPTGIGDIVEVYSDLDNTTLDLSDELIPACKPL